MNTPATWLYGRREEDAPKLVVSGINTSAAAMNIIHNPHLWPDLTGLITLFRTIAPGVRHNHFFQAILEHPNTSADVLQLLFFETKSIEKSGTILTLLLARYPDDVKVLAFVLHHGSGHFEQPRIYEILDSIVAHPQLDIATLVSLLEPIATDYVLYDGLLERIYTKVLSLPLESILLAFEEMTERALQSDRQSKYLRREGECDGWGDELLNFTNILTQHAGVGTRELERLKQRCPETFEVHAALGDIVQEYRNVWK